MVAVAIAAAAAAAAAVVVVVVLVGQMASGSRSSNIRDGYEIAMLRL